MRRAGPDPWLRLAWAFALLLPLLVLHRTFLRPATNLVAARPNAYPFDDPTTNATAMARAWDRFDRGDFSARDDRVFAPAPNAIALGEWYPLPSLVGYPFARLAGSVPLGVNVPYYLALVSFTVALYAFYARLAAPGLAALLGALLVTWGPSRMNTLGVLSPLATSFGLLALCAALDWQRSGRRSRLALFGAFVLLQGFTGLYGTALTALFGAVAFPLVAGAELRRPGRLGALAGTAAAAILPAALYHVDVFRLEADFGVVTDRATFEAHAADVLSILHGGIFGGPVRDLLEALVPGFPLGAAAFFPTLTVLAALGAWALGARKLRGEGLRSPVPWVLVAGLFFVASLGPVIRVAGRPVSDGPYALARHLPVLRSLRGIHRFDQPYGIALGAAAVLAFQALRRRFPSRALPAAACALVALDSWPADVPTYRFPEPSPAAAAIRSALPADAIVAHYPMGREPATRAWVDQLAHGRRVVNGWFTFEPLPHRWAAKVQGAVDGVVGLAMLRDFGADVVVVDPSRLDPRRRAGLAALHAPDAALGLRARSRAGDLDLYWFGRSSPRVLTLESLQGLTFTGREARLAGAPGSLVLYFGPEALDVEVRSPGAGSADRLRVPPVQPAPFRVTLEKPVPAGSEVRDARSGRLLGSAPGTGP